jgi:hypothetical protein
VSKSSPHALLNTQCSRLITIYQFHPASSIQYQVSSIKYPVSSIKYPVSSIKYPASSIQHPASSIKYPASSIQYPASSIQHPVSSIYHPVSSIQHLPSSIQHPVQSSPTQTTNKWLFIFLQFYKISFGIFYIYKCDFSNLWYILVYNIT